VLGVFGGVGLSVYLQLRLWRELFVFFIP